MGTFLRHSVDPYFSRKKSSSRNPVLGTREGERFVGLFQTAPRAAVLLAVAELLAY